MSRPVGSSDRLGIHPAPAILRRVSRYWKIMTWSSTSFAAAIQALRQLQAEIDLGFFSPPSTDLGHELLKWNEAVSNANKLRRDL